MIVLARKGGTILYVPVFGGEDIAAMTVGCGGGLVHQKEFSIIWAEFEWNLSCRAVVSDLVFNKRSTVYVLNTQISFGSK